MKNKILKQVPEKVRNVINSTKANIYYIDRLIRFAHAVYCFEKVNEKLINPSDVYITMTNDKDIIFPEILGEEKIMELNILYDVHLDTL